MNTQLSPELRLKVSFESLMSPYSTVRTEDLPALLVPNGNISSEGFHVVKDSKSSTSHGTRHQDSMVSIINRDDMSFSASAQTHEERLLLGRRRKKAELIANLGRNALPLCAYVGALRIANPTSRLQIRLALKPQLDPNFAERVVTVDRSEGTQRDDLIDFRATLYPLKGITLDSEPVAAIGNQSNTLNMFYDHESVEAAMTNLYGTAPQKAQELLCSALATESNPMHAAQLVAQGL